MTLLPPVRIARWLALATLTFTVGACRRGGVAASDGPPRVTSVAPLSIRMRSGEPITVEIRGSGFDAVDNTVTIGPATLTTVPSTDRGTRIALSVPDRVASGGGAAPQLWMSGQHPITVRTTRGTSAPMMITVVETR